MREAKSAPPSTSLSVTLQGRDLDDARRILEEIVLAGDRRAILSGAKTKVPPLTVQQEDPNERLASQMFRARRTRDELLPHGVSGHAAWDILLTLFLADRAGVSHNVGRIIDLSGSSGTTGLRHINTLEGHGLIERKQDSGDARIFYLNLSPEGRKLVDQILTTARSP